MKRRSLPGLSLGLVALAFLAACAGAPTIARSQVVQPGARTRILSVSRPNTAQATLLSRFTKDEGRRVTLKRDKFGHPVVGPDLSKADAALLKTLDADRRLVRENASRSLPGGMVARSTRHFQFFQPSAKVTPRIVPLYQAKGTALIGFRAEVESAGANPEEGRSLYFAYYDARGKLLAANG